jgi:hypothetical protein
MKLPKETLHQIYEYLAPQDFNAARHTCRSWFLASFASSILEGVLRRGGWSRSTQKLLWGTFRQVLEATETNQEWIMSKWISRECALGSNWPGARFGRKTDSFVEAGFADITSVGINYSTPRIQEDGVIFTISLCGRVLMLSHGCLVYVYELNHRCESLRRP